MNRDGTLPQKDRPTPLSAGCAPKVLRRVSSAANHMPQLKEWADLATMVSSIISLSAVIVAFFGIRSIYKQTLMQINDLHIENKKWKTLEICAHYELNDKISDSAKNIFIAFSKGEADEGACKAISRDAVVILNYLDGIAIGVGQGLYIEELARDHLKNIVECPRLTAAMILSGSAVQVKGFDC
jgi:hypothetical protein